MELAASSLCTRTPTSTPLDLCFLMSPLPVSQSSLAHPEPRFVKYLHSLVIHSESSRQEAPMGLRETPLQNGVILLDLFAEASSGTGEPLTCRAKAYPLQVGKHPLLHTQVAAFLRTESEFHCCYYIQHTYVFLTWLNSNRQVMSAAKSLSCNILAKGRCWSLKDRGQFPFPFIGWHLSAFLMVARWGRGKVCL